MKPLVFIFAMGKNQRRLKQVICIAISAVQASFFALRFFAVKKM